MLINNDYITPAELTGYVRAGAADLAANQFTLARWLPNSEIDDLEYRFTRGGEGLVEAATFRSYDAESPIAARPGIARVTGELPPISRKIRLGEYDRLRQRRLDGQVRNALMRDSLRMTRAVSARMELARGEALYKGKLELAENGVIATVDFGRSASHTVVPSVAWTDPAAAILADLMAWKATYIVTNGEAPGAILTSDRVVALMMRNDELRALVYAGGVSQPSVISVASINEVLRAYSLPAISTYEAQVRVGGVATRVIPDDRVLLLPAAGEAGDPESTDLGATLWGTTAESLDGDYGIEEGEEPGIVSGIYAEKDPPALWTKAAAIGLPVLANPDLSFCADVA
ncbi:phage capsid protein [Streptomyces sp. WAC 01529]|uniref:major capsid protein n=1 Tax=Streptomyces sp. WAC 01529 TaxID=2203205 RepID=UPI000F6DA98C|nr:major capsid protein [Streptomyces sp. WAC 01529]AZM53335.1 phage capsid protein [Streptomyces sp. WAC 01529]